MAENKYSHFSGVKTGKLATTPIEFTADGVLPLGRTSVEISGTSAIAVTVDDLSNWAGSVMFIKNTSASGTAAHTLTASAGTWDGTNDVLTLDAPDEFIAVYVDSAGNGTILENVGAVALS